MADEMRAYEPTMRERMADALQGGMEGLGVNRYKARKHAQTIMGGPSSSLPMNMGAADVAAMLNPVATAAMTPLYAQEGIRDLEKAGESAKRGDYIDAGIEGAFGAANVLPVVPQAIKAGKALVKKIKPMNLPKLQPIGTDSVPKKQSLKEWAMAGGGIPESYRDRPDVWHQKAQRLAAGGEVYNTVPDMADGGQLIDGPAFAGGGAVKKVVKDAVEGAVEGIKPMVDRLSMHFKDVTKRVPELQEGAQRVKDEAMTRAEYEKLVNKYKPVKPYEFIPKPATRDEAVGALTADKRGLYGAPSSTLQAGHPVGLRLDIPAYSDHGVWVPAVHQQDAGFGAGERIGYENVAGVLNPTFGMSEKAALNIAAGKPKGTIATIKGEWNPMDEVTAVARAQEYLNHPDWVQVGMDPERHSYFYDRRTMKPITAAEEAIQIGPLVLARKPQYGNKKDYKYADGGEAHMAKGGKVVDELKEGVKKGIKKLFGVADEAPKGVEPIVVRTPEERSVIEKFGQKHEQEAARAKKVEKLAKESAGQSPEAQARPAKAKGPRTKVEPDIYRKMAEEQGDEAVLKAARAGEHLKPTPGGYVGAPRTVTSGQGLGAMRRSMDKDFEDAVEAVNLADPERLGTWYDRAKQGIAESAEPYQLNRTLEQHGVYSAGVSPESELGFALKHLNSRVAGEPAMAYRGAPMRNLDTAVAEDRPANMGFKIGEYANKNDPRIPNEGLFGVNDFRRAQGMGYTDPQGNPWKAGVSETMHPFMDAETALQVDRANRAGTGGRTDWAGPHIQEVPWVYGKGQDIYYRGQSGRFKGDELEGIKGALQEANNTARDYMYKHAASATHEAVPGARLGHVPQVLEMSPAEKLEYTRRGRWDMPAPEAALNEYPQVGAGNRDILYGAAGYRQLPSREAEGLYINSLGGVENNPMTIARPLMDFPTGGGGLMAPESRRTMDFIEHFRPFMDAQEAGAYNLPNTMNAVERKNSMMLDTRGKNPDKLADPTAGVLPTAEQLSDMNAALERASKMAEKDAKELREKQPFGPPKKSVANKLEALEDAAGGFGVTSTNRGALVFPYNSEASAGAIKEIMKRAGPEIEAAFPGAKQQRSMSTMGYQPGIGKRSPEGPLSTAPFSGEATADLLMHAAELPQSVSQNIGESEWVRNQIREKALRDSLLGGTRKDIQESRRFFSEADWPKAVDMIRKGMTPAAALAALGYNINAMAADKR